MGDLLIVGEALCEFVRPERGLPLREPGVFHGPFPSGAPGIAASAAALAGAPVQLVATVGDDPFGQLFLQRMAADGVDVSRVRKVDAVTGVAFVAYDATGGREFVFHVADAAAAVMGPDDLGDAPERCEWIHVSGASLVLAPTIADTVVAATRRVHAAGGKVCLDPNLRPGSAGLAGAFDGLRELAELAGLVMPSAGELDALGVELGQLTSQGVIVCEKLGDQGVRVHHDGRVEMIPAVPVEEVDPTGCGDTFAGVFLATYIRTGNPVLSARDANEAAAAHVQALGPMERAPGWPSGRMSGSIETGS